MTYFIFIKVICIVDENLSKYLPSAFELEILGELCDLLQPLKELTYLFSGSSYVSMSFLFPALYSLINYNYTSMEFEFSQTEILKQELLRALNGRFNYLANNDVYVAATFLDFKFRKFLFVKEDDKREEYLDTAKTYLKKLNNKIETMKSAAESTSSGAANSIPNSETNEITLGQRRPLVNTTNTITTNSRTNLYRKRKINTGFLESICDNTTKVDEPLEPIEIEIQKYVENSFKLSDANEEELERRGAFLFFKIYGKTFPILTKLARIILSLPATSVPSESLFSQAGITNTDLRNRLRPNLLEQIVFLKSNK